MKKEGFAGQWLFVSTLLGLLLSGARAGEIVPGLDDSSAIANYTAARTGIDGELADITTGQMTLAARFNPDASQAAAGPVIVIENGGTSNGAGLYLANGRLVFCAKADNGRYSLPTSLNDTNFSNDGTGKSMAVDLGAVNCGAENNVYVSMDLPGGRLFAGVNGVTQSLTITGASGTENLDGNRSASFLGLAPIVDYGWLGGLVEEGNGNNAAALYPQLFWTNAVPMIQTAGYTNQRGQIFAAAISNPDLPYTVVVTESNGTTVKEGGQTDTISFNLTNDPMSYAVTISLTEVSNSGQVQMSTSQLVFDTNNWQTQQTVTLTAVDDLAREPRIHLTALEVQVQADPASPYFGLAVDDVAVSVIENDCGFWGYDQIDTNRDCQIDFEDFLSMVSSWLECSFPETGCADYRP